MTYYKFLHKDGTTPQGYGKWPMPKDGPGEWMPPIEGELIPCKNGYHVMTAGQVLFHLCRVDLYEVEVRGDAAITSEKIAVREARVLHRVEQWDEQARQDFISDCIAHAMPTPQLGDSMGDVSAAADVEYRAEQAVVDPERKQGVWGKTWKSERQWQSERLVYYLEGGA